MSCLPASGLDKNGYYLSTGNSEKTLKSLFAVNMETGAGDDAWLLSMPRSSRHRLRVEQGQNVLAVGVVVGLF